MNSPFRASMQITKQKVAEMFKEATEEALNRLQTPSILEHINEKDECLIVFDYLMLDHVLHQHGVHSEEFRALEDKYSIFNEVSLRGHIQALVDKLFEVNEHPKFKDPAPQ